jgi:hypothetical protein
MDLLEELKHLDEIDLLELLDITSEELVEAFPKRIQKRRKYLEQKLAGTEEGREDVEPDEEVPEE